MTTATKAEIVQAVQKQLGAPRTDAARLVDQFFEEICLCLEANEAVRLSGFGNFELRDKRPRPGRNPRTGEEVEVTARRVVTFHAGQKLKHRVDDGMGRI
jgi:integration host factor subunit alpha